MPWALAFSGLLATALLPIAFSSAAALVPGPILFCLGAGFAVWQARRRRALTRHVLAGGVVPDGGSGDPQLDRLLEAARPKPDIAPEARWLERLSAWAAGDLGDVELGDGSIPEGLNGVRASLVEDRERLRTGAAHLAAAAARGPQAFAEPARGVEACADALKKASRAVHADVEGLEGLVEELRSLAERWEQAQAEAARAEDAAAWSRQRLGRALDPSAWGALDREEEQIATALHRLVGNLEREPEHPDRMIWLGQARGQVEALERHRAAVHRGVEDARRALLSWKSVQTPDLARMEAMLRRGLEALRSLGETWKAHAFAAEAAAAEVVAGMPDVEWWSEEVARLQWELELLVVQGRTSAAFQSSLEAILARQQEGRTPGAAALARGLERLEARISDHAAELETAVRRIERLLGPP